MRHTVLLILLLSFTSWANAQGLDELIVKTKTTDSEKKSEPRLNPVPHQSKWIELDTDDETWGLSYSYSPNFPVAIGANYTTSYFSIGAELGFTCSGKEYEIKTNSTVKPVGFLMATPGLYCKYFSVNCGVGLLFDRRTKYKYIETGTTTTNTSLTVNGETAVEGSGINFCVKPSITGYIPICDGDYYITLNAGYMFVPKIKDLNGIACGIGFQITID